MRKVAIIFNLLLLLYACSNTTEYNNPNKVKVRSHAGCEIISTMFYLAEAKEYSLPGIGSYKHDLDENFDKFRNHPSIEYVRKLRSNYSISYDAPMSYAVYLYNDLTTKIHLDSLKGRIDGRWKPEEIKTFYKHMSNFERDTKYLNYFNAINQTYQKDISKLENEINKAVDFDWFDDFFKGNDYKFDIIFSYTNGRSNYGPKTNINGEEHFYAIIGLREKGFGKISLSQSVIGLIIHELCHSFCNRIVDNNQSELREIGEKLFEIYKSDKNAADYYNSPNTILKESIVRACVACYLNKHGVYNPDCDNRQGFHWTEGFAAFIDREYKEANYQSFDEFSPKIISFFENYKENN